MKGTKEIIEILNDALAGELTAIRQYAVHAAMSRHWGYDALAEHIHTEALEETKHADMLMDRILFLGGMPERRPVEMAPIGRSVIEHLKADLALQQRAVKELNKGITTALEKGDNTSAHLLVSILADEEKHVSWLETQLGLIDRIGEANYLQSQLGPQAAAPLGPQAPAQPIGGPPSD